MDSPGVTTRGQRRKVNPGMERLRRQPRLECTCDRKIEQEPRELGCVIRRKHDPASGEDTREGSAGGSRLVRHAPTVRFGGLLRLRIR